MKSVVASITVRVNDELRTFAAPITLLSALRELGVAERRGVAIAIDDEVVPRSAWPNRKLVDGSRLLVIQATQGG
jgi:sulfur carrier protein